MPKLWQTEGNQRDERLYSSTRSHAVHQNQRQPSIHDRRTAIVRREDNMSIIDNIYDNVKPEDIKLYNNFKEKIVFAGESDCWTWNAHINKVHQRPMFWFNSSWTSAARASLYLKQGYLTKGLHVCHDPITCDNTLCVNPLHLREDTPSANTKDLVITGKHNNKRKTHCPKNHEYSLDNTYYNSGRRYCKQCKIDKKKEKTNE